MTYIIIKKKEKGGEGLLTRRARLGIVFVFAEGRRITADECEVAGT
jgi:hypothetical protein